MIDESIVLNNLKQDEVDEIVNNFSNQKSNQQEDDFSLYYKIEIDDDITNKRE